MIRYLRGNHMKKFVASVVMAVVMVAGSATAANAVGNWPF